MTELAKNNVLGVLSLRQLPAGLVLTPENAVYTGRRMPQYWGRPGVPGWIVEAVHRGSPYGNPFRSADAGQGALEAVRRFGDYMQSHPDLVSRAQRELGGKWLLCWCVPGPCHGNVLSAIVAGVEPWARPAPGVLERGDHGL